MTKKALVPLANSPIAVRETELSKAALRKIGKELIDADVKDPFTLTDDLHDLAERARELNDGRETNEVELSAILHKLAEQRAYLQHNYSNLSEYAEGELSISGPKARAMVSNWQQFLELGLKPGILAGAQGVMFGKFKLLSRAISDGAIDKKNIAEWLPLLRKGGEGAATRSIIETRLRELRVNPENPEKAAADKRFSFKLGGDEAPGFVETLEVFKESCKVESDGAAIFRALTLAAAATIEDAAKQTTVMGLTGLINMMARLAPVVPIMYSTANDATHDKLGVHVVNKVYGSFRTDKNLGSFCLAANRAAAAETLGIPVDSVREFDLILSPELMPEVQFEGGLIRDVVVQDATAEESGDDSDSEPVVQETVVANITENDVNKQVTYNLKDKDGKITQSTGTISEVEMSAQIVRVKAGRGRPRSVPFAAVITVGDDAPTPKAADDAPKKRGRKPKSSTTIDLNVEVEEAVKNLEKNREEVQRIGAELVEQGKNNLAGEIKPHFEAALSHASAAGWEGAEQKALAMHSTAMFCKKLAKS